MSDDIYEQLADALDRLPNGFPRTASNVEIKLLKNIFSQKEASLVCQLSGKMEPVDKIAERLQLPVSKARAKLMKMVKRGLAWFSKKDGKPHFRLAPFIVGFYEAQLETMDHELAHLFEDYFMASGGAAGIMEAQPAVHRVIPAYGAVKSEWILPYDDVRALIEASKSFNVRDCICRVQQDLVGKRKCDFPLKNCLFFSSVERPFKPGDITKEEALAILDKTEEIGLVHTVSNYAKGFSYVCNCCGCCCGILRAINEAGIENSVAAANYYAVIDPDKCQACGICQERCQVHAISEQNGVYVIKREKCIGCGLCVTGCPDEAAELQQKPEAEIIHPPEDFATWEQERLKNRGLSD